MFLCAKNKIFSNSKLFKKQLQKSYLLETLRRSQIIHPRLFHQRNTESLAIWNVERRRCSRPLSPSFRSATAENRPFCCATLPNKPAGKPRACTGGGAKSSSFRISRENKWRCSLAFIVRVVKILKSLLSIQLIGYCVSSICLCIESFGEWWFGNGFSNKSAVIFGNEVDVNCCLRNVWLF